MKNQLAYSSLTDEVCFVNAKGNRVELPKGNFIQMLLLWLHQGKAIKLGGTYERTLSVNGQIHWKITIERVADLN